VRRQRRKYTTPRHPWEKERMDYEDQLLRRYGLRRKREIWKAQTILRGFRTQARLLLTRTGKQAELETQQLFQRLRKFGLVGENPTLDDVLGLTVERVIERFLQWVVYQRGLARTPRHARQLVVHGHVRIGGRRVRSPTYMVPVSEEELIEVTLPAAKEAEAPLPAGAGEGETTKAEAAGE
jgi:small subunit ribosomal protein S4